MIAFIDSGVGGLNILIECAKLYKQDFVYLADNKNAPYGSLSKKQLEKITKQNVEFLMKNYSLSAIVFACNTISASVGEKLKNYYNIPIILTKPNINKLKNYKKQILFLGTKNTLKNNKEINSLIRSNADYMGLYIENLPKIIDENLSQPNNVLPLLKLKINYKKYKNIKTICLCCTHFRLIKKQLKNCFVQNVEFFEYEKEIAKQTLPYINPETLKNTFKIVLTQDDLSLYVSLKKYLVKRLNSKNI